MGVITSDGTLTKLDMAIFNRLRDVPELQVYVWNAWAEEGLLTDDEVWELLEKVSPDPKKIWDVFVGRRKMPDAPVARHEYYDFVWECLHKGLPAEVQD